MNKRIAAKYPQIAEIILDVDGFASSEFIDCIQDWLKAGYVVVYHEVFTWAVMVAYTKGVAPLPNSIVEVLSFEEIESLARQHECDLCGYIDFDMEDGSVCNTCIDDRFNRGD